MKQPSDGCPDQRAETHVRGAPDATNSSTGSRQDRAKHLSAPKEEDKEYNARNCWRRDKLTCARVLVCALARGRIPVPRALNQAFKIINLITLSVLLLSLQLLAFGRCWKGQAQPHISLKATHPKQQDDTSRSNNHSELSPASTAPCGKQCRHQGCTHQLAWEVTHTSDIPYTRHHPGSASPPSKAHTSFASPQPSSYTPRRGESPHSSPRAEEGSLQALLSPKQKTLKTNVPSSPNLRIAMSLLNAPSQSSVSKAAPSHQDTQNRPHSFWVCSIASSNS